MASLRSLSWMVMVGALALVLSSCAGGDDQDADGGTTEPGQTQAEGEGQEPATCSGEMLAVDELGLPDDFPLPDGLVLVDAAEAGPSNTADGYFDGDIETAYEMLRGALEDASYRITFDEIERDDAEITYETPDGASDGIVELRARCGTEDRIAVHVTSRPA